MKAIEPSLFAYQQRQIDFIGWIKSSAHLANGWTKINKSHMKQATICTGRRKQPIGYQTTGLF